MIKKTVIKKIKKTQEGNFCLVDTFKIFSNVERLRIFNCLLEKKELTAEDIAQIFKISRVRAASYLKIMETNDIILPKEKSSTLCYSLNNSSKNVLLIKNCIF